MKKTISILSITLIAILLLVSCGGNKSKKAKLDGEVKLASVTATKPTTKSNMSAIINLDNDTQQSPPPTYSYLILQKKEKNFDLTILLDNPSDYHIFDFTLTCEDKSAKIKLDGSYVLLTSVASINWRGDTNTRYTIQMQSASTNYKTGIELTSLYFSDRKDGTSRYEADLQNNGLVDIYKADDGIIYTHLGCFNHKFTINDEHVDLSSIKLNGDTITFTNGEYNYTSPMSASKAVIEYSYILDDDYTAPKKNDINIETPKMCETTFTSHFSIMITIEDGFFPEGQELQLRVYNSNTDYQDVTTVSGSIEFDFNYTGHSIVKILTLIDTEWVDIGFKWAY